MVNTSFIFLKTELDQEYLMQTKAEAQSTIFEYDRDIL